jgi:hypothetical protein
VLGLETEREVIKLMIAKEQLQDSGDEDSEELEVEVLDELEAEVPEDILETNGCDSDSDSE